MVSRYSTMCKRFTTYVKFTFMHRVKNSPPAVPCLRANEYSLHHVNVMHFKAHFNIILNLRLGITLFSFSK